MLNGNDTSLLVRDDTLKCLPTDQRLSIWSYANEHLRCTITCTVRCRTEGAAMIPSGARVWIALGRTDMMKGMQGLALLVHQGLKRNSRTSPNVTCVSSTLLERTSSRAVSGESGTSRSGMPARTPS